MSNNLVWVPKKINNCSICNSDHGHKYKIIEHGIWWEDGPVYVTQNFCSICFTVINQLWPNEIELVNSKNFTESGFHDHRDRLDHIIKNNFDNYTKFTEYRTRYVNKLNNS